ncbi:MAG: GNAT family N-acetyltransferase [Methanomassiliicoccus sp.]|mgnify:CR=1 FL=1|nr:GNAT family N-acetyltransferase [Methanomassiliicoccus sp.]
MGLRPMLSEDSWLFYKWFNDQRVLADMGLKHALFCVSVEEERARIGKKLSSPTDRDFIIVDLESEHAIGWAGLSHIDLRNSTAEVNVVIGEPQEWDSGKGIEATRMLVDHAFEVMNMHRLYLRVAEYNERAIACFTTSGFTVEGTMKDDHYHHGKYASSHLMSILREEGGRR